jgi:hypothetical protein
LSPALGPKAKGVALSVAVFFLAACAPAPELTLEQAPPAPEASPDVGQAPLALSFIPPDDCTVLLPGDALSSLTGEGIELLQGPGSPSPDPIYVDGQTPEELVGGLSCLFGLPGDDDSGMTIVLSAAPVDPALRPSIISGLLGQNLNVGQTLDGTGLTYWVWGDEGIRPALHNELYEDAWYSALIQPGGRPAYDRAVVLVGAMRALTTE